MKILVVGNGGREHALAWRLRQGGGEREILCAPGNGGTAAFAESLDVGPSEVDRIVAVARDRSVDLVVVGPEAPLVAGLTDALRAEGIAAFGPSKEAARLEGSKAFSKHFMKRHGVPTAAYEVFDEPDAAEAYIRAADRPLVVKADGLAAGKGVVVAKDAAEAIAAVQRIMRDRAFGEAGAEIVVEECLRGQEVSYHVVSDGQRFVPMAPAQDHKRAYDGDRGPNTGGMGAYSPPPVVTAEVEQKILSRVIEPTLAGMSAEGHPFTGALFVGLMVDDGEPNVLEYNVRFGDPECECLMARWDGDVLPLLLGSARGDLGGVEPRWAAPCALTVVLASGGYPGSYEKGKRITGVDEADAMEGVTVLSAGTSRSGDDLVTSGGRVLAVTAIGDSVDTCAARAYRAADAIEFEGKMLRRDIGHHARTT